MLQAWLKRAAQVAAPQAIVVRAASPGPAERQEALVKEALEGRSAMAVLVEAWAPEVPADRTVLVERVPGAPGAERESVVKEA